MSMQTSPRPPITLGTLCSVDNILPTMLNAPSQRSGGKRAAWTVEREVRRPPCSFAKQTAVCTMVNDCLPLESEPGTDVRQGSTAGAACKVKRADSILEGKPAATKHIKTKRLVLQVASLNRRSIYGAREVRVA